MCYFSKKSFVQIKGFEFSLEEILKDVLPEHNNIYESRRV